MGERLRSWLQSDLIGIVATLTALVAAVIAIVVYIVVGSVAGVVVGVLLVALTFYVVSKIDRGREDLGGISSPRAESSQQVLVLANHGLSAMSLEDELARRAARGPLTVKIVVPVSTPSPTHRIADDVDAEIAAARQRLDARLARLSERGVSASGHVDPEAPPVNALMDGLREFHADEVLMVPRAETVWEEAESLAGRIRAETDIRITELPAD